MPSPTPTVTAKKIERNASSAVAGMKVPSSVVTGRPGLLGLAEVAVREPPDVDAVLLRQRLVEPVALTEGRDGSRVLDRALAQVRRGRVARHEVREHERDERDPEHQEDERSDPPRDESEEGPGRPHCAAAPAVPREARVL